MYDEYKTYQKNHDLTDVKKRELEKIAKERHVLLKAKRKMHKHKYRNAQELDNHYDDILQSEHFVRKTSKNINTRKECLKNFIKNGHV